MSTGDHSLQTARQTRHSIGIAQGLLIYRYGQTEEISFQVLRRLSSHKNIKLREVANQVIHRVPDNRQTRLVGSLGGTDRRMAETLEVSDDVAGPDGEASRLPT